MICPYCKNSLYVSDLHLSTKIGIVDVYECENDNRMFVLFTGEHFVDDGFGNVFDLRTGEQIRTSTPVAPTT